MIRLTKENAPDVLRESAEEWTKELLEVLALGEKPTATLKRRYAHASIKEALLAETNGKCAYCESKLRHIAYGDIEHVVPKSEKPELSYEWTNLTLACDVCNTNKGDKVVDIVDPYEVDPGDHLFFAGETVWPVPASDKGLLTERTLILNRPELVEQRKKRLDGIWRMLDGMAKTTTLDARAVMRRDIEREMRPEHEYSAMVQTFLSGQLEQAEEDAAAE